MSYETNHHPKKSACDLSILELIDVDMPSCIPRDKNGEEVVLIDRFSAPYPCVINGKKNYVTRREHEAWREKILSTPLP